MFGATAAFTAGVGTVPRSRALVASARVWLCVVASAVAMLAAVVLPVARQTLTRHAEAFWIPTVSPRPPLATFYDVTPVEVTVTRQWLKFSFVVPRYQFIADPTIWRQMHFEDWDRLDTTTRREGLTRLFAAYGHFVADPSLWRRMHATDWDDVPQPVRAMAIVGMIERWVGYYRVGRDYALDDGLVLRTAKAIAMSESWFDHRARHVNRDGSADIGIGGASAFARDAIRRLYERDLADFTLADDDYSNPWLAARALAFWLRLSLDEAGGDLALAIGAYNVGIGRARQGLGTEYRAGVERRRQRYFEGPSSSPTWSALSQFRRDQGWIPRVIVRPLLPARPTAPPELPPWGVLPAAPAMAPPELPTDAPGAGSGD